MILVDCSQIVIAAAFADRDFVKTYDEKLLRHMILNTIRSYRVKHKKEFGEIVLCYDSQNCWRKDIFPYYKAHRQESKDAQAKAGTMDFEILFRMFSKIQSEFIQFLPYKQVAVPRTEADDVIAVLTKHVTTNMLDVRDPVLILSSDHDFKQLHKFSNVRQFSPLLKKWVEERAPIAFLENKILTGDKGDGVPNVLSADDCIITKKRQTPLTESRIAEIKRSPSESIKRNIDRNANMIDMELIPEEYQNQILDVYNSYIPAARKELRQYFTLYKMNAMMEYISDF